MDVIAGRKTAGKIEGSITVNGQPQDKASYRRISAYVEQSLHTTHTHDTSTSNAAAIVAVAVLTFVPLTAARLVSCLAPQE